MSTGQQGWKRKIKLDFPASFAGKGSHVTSFWPMRCERKSAAATSALSSVFLPVMQSWDSVVLQPRSDRNEAEGAGAER